MRPYDISDAALLAMEQEGFVVDETSMQMPHFGELRRTDFQDPGGDSALRRASKRNPRNLPCPTCHQPNRLTAKDVALGYQCNTCARQDEGGF